MTLSRCNKQAVRTCRLHDVSRTYSWRGDSLRVIDGRPWCRVMLRNERHAAVGAPTTASVHAAARRTLSILVGVPLIIIDVGWGIHRAGVTHECPNAVAALTGLGKDGDPGPGHCRPGRTSRSVTKRFSVRGSPWSVRGVQAAGVSALIAAASSRARSWASTIDASCIGSSGVSAGAWGVPPGGPNTRRQHRLKHRTAGVFEQAFAELDEHAFRSYPRSQNGQRYGLPVIESVRRTEPQLPCCIHQILAGCRLPDGAAARPSLRSGCTAGLSSGP